MSNPVGLLTLLGLGSKIKMRVPLVREKHGEVRDIVFAKTNRHRFGFSAKGLIE
jgi:hypothetical protein